MNRQDLIKAIGHDGLQELIMVEAHSSARLSQDGDVQTRKATPTGPESDAEPLSDAVGGLG